MRRKNGNAFCSPASDLRKTSSWLPRRKRTFSVRAPSSSSRCTTCGRVRAAVDQISQENDDRVRGAARGVVTFHSAKQIVEQVQPPVDVAHGIDARAGRDRSPRPRLHVALPGERRKKITKHDITAAHDPCNLPCRPPARSAAGSHRAGGTGAAATTQTSELHEALRTADMRVAATGFRLSTAAAGLCDRQEPGTGIQLHTLAQYAPGSRAQVRAHFGMAGTAAVEGVVPGSPADRAGIRADDTIVKIGTIAPPDTLPAEASVATLEALYRQIAELPPGEPIEIAVLRNGKNASFHRPPAARLPHPLRIAHRRPVRRARQWRAGSDHVKYIEDVDPELFPAVVAHELAHNILRHRVRLIAAGASFGLASGFGRNVRLFRQTEIQADILSVHLLARAGYAPSLAARFLREVGPRLLEGQIPSRSHPPIRARAGTVEAEAARPAADGKLPAFYARRNAALTGEWQSLLVRGGD
ncbi:PDZ domain-containing protein [Ditylenchus destructor]|uniref:PDZ domain-containing protein n=1 Tax=Ditylenchus destructor TaxID=166010 RepID=A0AAD4MGN9_9BILA|nr:PDZ domain-containing protein [Ditylenchus destructor]